MSSGQASRTRANFPRMKIRNPKPWKWIGTRTVTTFIGNRQITFGPALAYAIPASAANKRLIREMSLTG